MVEGMESILAQFNAADTVEATQRLIARYGLNMYCVWLDERIAAKSVTPAEISAWASLPEAERVRA